MGNDGQLETVGMKIETELKLLCPKIGEVRSKAIDDARRLSVRFPPRNNTMDARANVPALFVNTIEGFHLSLQLMRTSLDNPAWWEMIAGRPLALKEVAPSLKAFYEVQRFAFIALLVGVLDASFRRLLRAVRPGMCNNATGAFQSISRCLFKSLDKKPDGGEELLELLRLSRNTIHTNGYFFPKNGKSETAIWRGRTFKFDVGKLIMFSWEDLIEAADATRQLLVDVIEDAAISDHSEFIPGVPFGM